MQSKAKTVAQYLAELPPDRRQAVEGVRKVILANLDKGYEEGIQYGMISYYVPHSVYPPGYHCDPKQPLPFTCLASQKGYLSLYLMSIYMDRKALQSFQDACAERGKKLNMGKSCIRFKKLEDLPLDVIGQIIRRTPAKAFIANYEAGLKAPRAKPAAKRPAPKRTAKAALTKKAANAAKKSTDRRKAAKTRTA